MGVTHPPPARSASSVAGRATSFTPVLRYLTAAKVNGQRFDDAWPHAIQLVSRNKQWALTETRDGWAAAYDGTPAPHRTRVLTILD